MFNSNTPATKMIMYAVLIMAGLLFVGRLSAVYNGKTTKHQDNKISICDCENAYRSVMYGEGSHSKNKYTGETYNTLDADGNSYLDVIDRCAGVYGGVPLNDGGFSKHPDYQECIALKNIPSENKYPDTLIVQWDSGNTKLSELNVIGGYLYNDPWNPHGFVTVYRGNIQDNYGNYSAKNITQTHYIVSRRFQLEAKKFAGADYYRWKTWTSSTPGTFGSFINCMEKRTTSSGNCDCTYILKD